MKRNKRLFILFSVLFVLILIYIGIDISTRTTFPGENENVEDTLKNEIEIPADSIMILENT